MRNTGDTKNTPLGPVVFPVFLVFAVFLPPYFPTKTLAGPASVACGTSVFNFSF